MDPVAALVRSGPTELTRLARAAVAGLASALEAGLSGAPGDAAARECADAVAHLRSLLGKEAVAPSPVERAVPAPSAAASEVGSWAALCDSWSKTREWGEWIGAVPPNDAELPRRLWLATHRVPPDTADAWRTAWLRTGGLKGEPSGGESVAGPFDALLMPPLDGSPAVRLSATAAVDSRLGESPFGEIAGRLARTVSAVLWFTEHDPALRHVLRSIARFGVSPVPGPHRPRYVRALVDRFEALRRAEDEGDGAGLVSAWVELDEAVHSLTFDPHPHPRSTFGELARASREALSAVRDRASAGGATVHVQVPSGRYADCRGLTDPDADVEVAAGAAPGDVARCVRVFARVNGTAHPGRVAYRPR